MSYQPIFNRFAKGAFSIDNSFIGIQAGSEAYLLEDELNELQWIQYEQKAQSNRSLLNSGILYNFPVINGTTNVLNNTINIKDRNTLLWSIKDYVPININGYTLRLCGTYRKDIKNAATNYNNILINLSSLQIISGSVNELIYLEVWFENINCTLNNKISLYGGQGNDFVQFSKDERINEETTQRIQLKWRIKTAQNKSDLSQIYPADSTDYKYTSAKLLPNEVYSFDDNLYVGKVPNKSKGNNIDGIYYAIPLFLIKRTPNNIQTQDISLVYPKCELFVYNIKNNNIIFGNNDNGIILENNSNDLYIKNKLNQLTNIFVKNISTGEVTCNSITTTNLVATNISSDNLSSKDFKIFSTDKSKFIQMTTGTDNLLNIKTTQNTLADINLNKINSNVIDSKEIRVLSSDNTTSMGFKSESNEIKVKKISNNNLVDLGASLYSEKLASQNFEIRDSSSTSKCLIKNNNGTVNFFKNSAATEYANITVGNIIIKGNATTIESETVTIADNIVVLNSNISSSTAPTENSGLEVNRGNAKASSLLWDESEDVWKAGLKGSEDIILLKSSPTIKTPTIDGLLTVKNSAQEKINLVTPSGSDCKIKINVLANTTIQSSIGYDGSSIGKKLWTITTNNVTNKIATINSNNLLCNNLGELSYIAIQGGASNSKPTAKGINVLYVGTNDRKIYYDTNINGSNQWLEVGRPSNLPDCDSNFAYDTKPSNFSDSQSKKLYYNGYIYANRVYNAVYNDYAEYFKKGDSDVEPGDVIMYGSDNKYIKSQGEYNNLVVGVFSDTYGHLLGGEGNDSDEKNYIPIGLSGRVNVKVVGDVKAGDLLVSSEIPGVAKASNKYLPGTVIGKALENHSGNDINRINMLIMNI